MLMADRQQRLKKDTRDPEQVQAEPAAAQDAIVHKQQALAA
jgi:hypothetical protein